MCGRKVFRLTGGGEAYVRFVYRSHRDQNLEPRKRGQLLLYDTIIVQLLEHPVTGGFKGVRKRTLLSHIYPEMEKLQEEIPSTPY